MIKELQDCYNRFAKPLDEFSKPKNTISGGLEYKKIWAEAFNEFNTKIEEIAQRIQKGGNNSSDQIKKEIARLQVMFKNKF